MNILTNLFYLITQIKLYQDHNASMATNKAAEGSLRILCSSFCSWYIFLVTYIGTSCLRLLGIILLFGLCHQPSIGEDSFSGVWLVILFLLCFKFSSSFVSCFIGTTSSFISNHHFQLEISPLSLFASYICSTYPK